MSQGLLESKLLDSSGSAQDLSGQVIDLLRGETPSTGAQPYQPQVRYSYTDGVTALNFAVRRARLRLATAASSGNTTVTLQKYNGAGAFSATDIGTITIAAGTHEGGINATTGPGFFPRNFFSENFFMVNFFPAGVLTASSIAVASGDKLRVNVDALGTDAAGLTLTLELGVV